MSLMTNTNHTNYPFIHGGDAIVEPAATFAREIGRTAAVDVYTLLSRDSTGDYQTLKSVARPAMTAGYMTGAVNGATLAEWHAVDDGEFGITVDGQALSITGLDFGDTDLTAATPGYMTCDTNGGLIAAYNAVSDGAFSITVDGTAIELTALDFTNADLITIAESITYAAAGRFTCEYDREVNKFRFISPTVGVKSSVSVLSTIATPAGTDISGASFLNGATTVGTPTAGTGSPTLGTDFTHIAEIVTYAAAGRFTCEYDKNTNKFRFVSPISGTISSVSALSDIDGAGTDVSGAAFFNALAAAATVTAGTGNPSANIPSGILLRNLTAAAVAAADVVNVPVIIGGRGLIVDKNQIDLEGSLTLASIVYAGDKWKTIADCLAEIGIFVTDVVASDEFENA